jgi:nitrate/nitrite transporter NarK
MTDNQIVVVVTLLAGIAYWFFIHRKLQRKNQLLITIGVYILVIISAWSGSDKSWKFALFKTIVFGAMIAFSIEELINLRKKDNVVSDK